MLINFANLSNEGANIPSLQKTGRTYTGGKKEILGAGDLAQALNDAKAQRLISDEEIEYYVKDFYNSDDAFIESEELEIKSHVYQNKDLSQRLLYGEKSKTAPYDLTCTFSAAIFDRKSESMIFFESHFIYAYKDSETDKLICYIDKLPID